MASVPQQGQDCKQESFRYIKVENILKGSLDSITSPSPSVKIQIMGGKVSLTYKGKTFLGIVNKLFYKQFVDNIQQCFAFTPFSPIIWIFTEGEGDVIESRLSS